MRSLRWAAAMLLVASLMTLTACAKTAKEPESPAVTLDGIRKQVAASFDGTAASAQRRAAGDEAMRQLLLFLSQPDSTSVTDSDWSASPRPGVEQMVRHLDLDGGVHLYALVAPGTSLVESRERVAAQVRKSGSAPLAMELAVLPTGQLEAARVFTDGSQQILTLLMRTADREGYVALFTAGADGRFAMDSGAFTGMAGQFGDLVLGLKEGFLTVSATDQPWMPAFDPQSGRLLLGQEVTLDWRQRYVLVDDSRFDPFYLMALAGQIDRCKTPDVCPEAIVELARSAPQKAAAAAWEQATIKLAALLQKESGWTGDLTQRLPANGRLLRQEGRDLVTTLLSIPAPDGLQAPAFTAVQFRTGGGMPMVRRLDLPGPVIEYRVVVHEGLPALFVVVDQTADPKGSPRSHRLQLLRLDAGGDWKRAEGWVGAVPEAAQWNLANISPDGLNISWDNSKSPNAQVVLESGPEGRVEVCMTPSDCHYLTWVDDRLHALDILRAQLSEATQQLPEGQLLWLANQLAEFLRLVDPAAVPAARLARLLDPDGRLSIEVLEAGGGTRLVTMPQNPTGLGLAVIHTQSGAYVVKAYDGFVTRWEDAKVVTGGAQHRLLLLGRSNKGAVLVAYDWDGARWLEGDALDAPVNRIIKESMVVSHTPGSIRPVRGLVVTGGNKLMATLTETGARFCEDSRACVDYGYDNSWRVK